MHAPSIRSESADDPLMEVDDVVVRFGRQDVLRNITLTVPRGQTLAIIGESGCGKTVLMKTMIGLIRPTQGKVFFEGDDLSRLSDKELTKLRMRYGFVFQMAALFDSMTVEQNVAFPLRQHSRMSHREIRDVVMARISEVGLPANVLVKKPAELSGGMRKRVGLARALALGPELVLYDEPTTGLDPIMSDVINELILRTRDAMSVTSVIVTHDMSSARKVADRIVMLYPIARLQEDESQILYDGAPDAIEQSDDPRVVQFVRGEAGERLMEMRDEAEQNSAYADDLL